MATATIQVAYEAETSSLKATVNEINQINDKVVEGAQKAAKQSADAFKKVGESLSSAFAGENVKKALNNINVESLTLVKSLDKVVKEVKLLANTADDVAKLEDQLRELALAGKSNTAEFDKIAKAVGTYKSAITTADRAVEAYAKSTDAASSRVGILEDKLYDLAIAGKQDTKEFKELVQESARLKKAIFETDQQVDSFVERGRKLNTVVQNVQLVGAAFQAVEGISAAFGQENEELQKTLVKLNAVLAITGALEQARAILVEQSAKKTGIAAIAENAYAFAVGKSTGALKLVRIALAATGVGALVIGLIALYENFDKVKQFAYNAIPGLESFANGVGKVVDAAKKLVGIEDPKKSVDLVAKLVENEKRKVAAQEASITSRINLLKAENKDTAALEIQREQLLLNFTNKKIAAVKQASGAAAAAGIDASKVIFDLQQEALQQESNIQIKRAEINTKAVEAAKKAEEEKLKAREALAKLELDTFNASLDEQSRILNDSNNKIAEREKAFRDARFKAGSAEEKAAQEQLNNAIIEIRTKAATDIAAVEKTANEKLFKDNLDAAKAAEGATLQQQLTALEAQKAIELSFAERLGLSKLDIETRYAGLIGKVKKDVVNQELDLDDVRIATLRANGQIRLEDQIKEIENERDRKINALDKNLLSEKEYADKVKLYKAEADEATTATTKSEAGKQVEIIAQYAKIVTDSLNSLNELSKMGTETRIADIEAASAAELEAINATTATEREKILQRDALAKRTAIAVAAEKTKQAKLDKALAIFEIGVNTAIAISKANTLLPPANIPAMIAAGIAGALQLAVVIAKPIPKFAKGGLIGGRLHSQGGTLIEAEQGEYMVNRRQSSKHRRELDAMNTSTEAFRRMIDERYVRPALMGYSASRRGKEGVTVNASLNSKSMEKELRGMRKDLKSRNVIVNINQEDSRYQWQ
jgi:hypothetical protein